MAQIFGIYCINGLPDTSSIRDLYNIPSIDNLSHNLTEIKTQSRSAVYIASDPAGAKIFIDDIEQVGFNTPSMITNILPGNHNFRLTSPGHIDIESAIPLEHGRTYNIFLTMEKSIPTSTSTDSSGLIILLTLGLIGFLLIKNK